VASLIAAWIALIVSVSLLPGVNMLFRPVNALEESPGAAAWSPPCTSFAKHGFNPDPFGRVDLIPMAHEGRIVPLEAERDREWKEIA
jgi:hypothetical protein